MNKFWPLFSFSISVLFSPVVGIFQPIRTMDTLANDQKIRKVRTKLFVRLQHNAHVHKSKIYRKTAT